MSKPPRRLGVANPMVRVWVKGWARVPVARQHQPADFLGLPLADLCSDEKPQITHETELRPGGGRTKLADRCRWKSRQGSREPRLIDL